jgi:hypothetical protein
MTTHTIERLKVLAKEYRTAQRDLDEEQCRILHGRITRTMLTYTWHDPVVDICDYENTDEDRDHLIISLKSGFTLLIPQ